MSLPNLWFTLIAVLWCGYFMLEGFDFGVGVLLQAVGRDERERGLMLRTIGPVWDGNEVWLLVAGGATFAAFPQWYATLFSGFYLALLLILVALIVRIAAVEYRNKETDPVWRRRGTGRTPSAPPFRRCCGEWRSGTSCAACRSTRRTTTQGPSSPCSILTPCSAA
jgi:cytochrome bd-type quinol oxidase subunit 2